MIDSSTVPPRRLCSLLPFAFISAWGSGIGYILCCLNPPLPQISSIFPNTGAMVYLSLGHVSAVKGLRVITHCFL